MKQAKLLSVTVGCWGTANRWHTHGVPGKGAIYTRWGTMYEGRGGCWGTIHKGCTHGVPGKGTVQGGELCTGGERGLLGDYTQRMDTWSAREGEFHEEGLEHLGALGILNETAPLQLLICSKH